METASVHRNILVTGAAGGLGREISTRLARAGFGVAMLDTSDTLEATAAAVSQINRSCAYVKADVRELTQVAAALEALQSSLGPIDGLVNNAAVVSHVAPFVRMSVDRWRDEVEINLTAPFHITQAVLPSMIERGWGRIVNVSSLAGRGGLYFQAGYSATKSGLLGLTRVVALEHARHGVTCNSILPGLIETEAVAQLPPALRDDAVSLIPARRTGRPDEVAALVAFLCSDDAAYINGAEIDVSGGAQLNQVVLGSAKEVMTRRTVAADDRKGTADQSGALGHRAITRRTRRNG